MTITRKPASLVRTFIEVVETATKKVVRRVEVTRHGERARDRIDSGMNINLNHSEYHTRVVRERKCLR